MVSIERFSSENCHPSSGLSRNSGRRATAEGSRPACGYAIRVRDWSVARLASHVTRRRTSGKIVQGPALGPPRPRFQSAAPRLSIRGRRVSGLFQPEAHADCACDPDHRVKTGVPLIAQSLIEALATETSLPRDLAHAVRASHVA